MFCMISTKPCQLRIFSMSLKHLSVNLCTIYMYSYWNYDFQKKLFQILHLMKKGVYSTHAYGQRKYYWYDQVYPTPFCIPGYHY